WGGWEGLRGGLCQVEVVHAVLADPVVQDVVDPGDVSRGERSLGLRHQLAGPLDGLVGVRVAHALIVPGLGASLRRSRVMLAQSSASTVTRSEERRVGKEWKDG